jgi:hypothetical protein
MMVTLRVIELIYGCIVTSFVSSKVPGRQQCFPDVLPAVLVADIQCAPDLLKIFHVPNHELNVCTDSFVLNALGIWGVPFHCMVCSPVCSPLLLKLR